MRVSSERKNTNEETDVIHITQISRWKVFANK